MAKTCVFIIFAMSLNMQAATIVASAPDSSYTIGDRIPVDISISNVNDLYAFQLDLSFDPSVVSAQSVTEGGYFLANGVSFSPGTIDNTAGTISFIADSLSGPATGTSDTLLVTAVFTALAPGSTQVSPENTILLDSNLSSIAASTSAASVTVSGVATPEPGSLGLVGGVICASLLGSRKRRSFSSEVIAIYSSLFRIR